MRPLRIVFAAALAALTLPLAAQQSSTSNMDILRDKLKGDRKVLVAANMNLSDAEAKNFWPIYDAYQKELSDLNTRTIKVIEDYAAATEQGRISNAAARDLLSRVMDIDQDEVRMKKNYVSKMQRVLPDAIVARWAQIENKIRAAVRYELAASIPLVE
ncbi:MAG TPA: hypothetical protein VFS34_04835 [Thermoanaerobaculia bacterium]|nr:hypothetical protein [Thermoanaerobaculia bacterium]